MNQDILEVLEFHQIQKMLAGHATSALSKEKALSWTPSVRREEILAWQEETEEASVCLEREVSSPLGETKDIREFLEKAEKNVMLMPQECMDLAVSLETYLKMRRFFEGERAQLYPALALLSQEMTSHEPLVRRIRRTFDEHGEVADGASPKLARIRGEMATAKGRIRRAFQRILSDKDQASYFQDALVTQRAGRYVIPVKAEYRYKFQGIVHDRSATGQTLFMEPMVSVELNNDLAELAAEEKQEIQEILRSLSKEVGKEAESIRADCRTATDLEFIFARASLALSMHGVRAILSVKEAADLRSARHPLIPADRVVPISISLGKTFRILVITGSNTGGKTVALKTLGLLALMNQAGLFIPAAEGSELPIYDHIYAVIGDDQSIQSNLSTFSSYITQLVAFLPQVEKNDLVLLDELGSGTDPVEGAALAQAVTEYLHEKDIPAVVTSHFSEMKKLAYDTEDIENAFVEFNMETLTPTYRLIIGMAGNSNAFSICRKLGMGETILSRAESLKEMSPLHHMESVMARVNEELAEAEHEREALSERVKEAEELRDDLKREHQRFLEKKKQILDKSREEAETLKRNLRIQSEMIIKNLKKQAARLGEKDLMSGIDAARKSVDGLYIPRARQEGDPLGKEKLVKGARVYVDTFDSDGVIESAKGNKITVRCGTMTVTVSPAHCFPPKKTEKAASVLAAVRVKKPKAMAAVKAVKTEVNVIGLTVDEAIPEVDRFLNDAFMAGVSPVRIIHGKGTGALREGIQNYLRTLPYIKEYHTADMRNGGAGATEVYF